MTDIVDRLMKPDLSGSLEDCHKVLISSMYDAAREILRLRFALAKIMDAHAPNPNDTFHVAQEALQTNDE